MLLNLIVEQQWKAWLAHPLDIQQSMGIKRVKNDKMDALRIAQYARTFREKARLFTAQNLKLDKLKHLLTRRQHLVRVRAMYKKHIPDLNRYMYREIQKVFDQLDKRLMAASDRAILRVEQLILAQIRGDQQSSTVPPAHHVERVEERGDALQLADAMARRLAIPHLVEGCDGGVVDEAQRRDLGAGGNRGVLVDKVQDGAAQSAGIRPGDLILMMNNESVKNLAHYRTLVQGLPAGKSVAVLVQREENRQFIALRVPK